MSAKQTVFYHYLYESVRDTQLNVQPYIEINTVTLTENIVGAIFKSLPSRTDGMLQKQ